jgi:hypothetical protein
MGPRLVAQVAHLAPSFRVPFQSMKGHFKNWQQPSVGFNGGLAAVFGLLVGCQPPCMSGFERRADRVCHATSPCGPGEARGTDLLCHPASGSTDDTAVDEVQPDSGESGGGEDTGLTDSGGPQEGPGRIRVLYPALTGYPAHGFIVFASSEGSVGATSAYCQIILAAEVDVDGYLQAYDGEADPCPSFGEALVFESGAVQLSMVVTSGAEADPVLCDERSIQVMGDTTVDFSGVSSCTE